MNVWHDVEIGKKAPGVVNVIIEIPNGSQNKYEFDKETGLIKLDRVLFGSMRYPADYGIIPKTLAEDGDPLDALVIVTNPLHPGTLVEVRPVAMLNMLDKGEKDEKILCVAEQDPRYSHVKDIEDINPHLLKEISNFFQRYKDLEGKKVEVGGWKNAEAAKSMIGKCQKLYNKKFKK